MSRFPRLLIPALAVLTLAMVCLPAKAQPPGRPRGPGRGPMMGRFGGGANVLTVLNSKSVQELLGTNEEQNSKFKEMAEKRREEMRGRFSELREKSDEERRAAMTKYFEEAPAREEKLRKEVAEVLSTEQNKKLTKILAQVFLQTRGPSALVQKPVVEVVGLSKEQTEKIQAILDKSREQMREFFSGGRERSEEERAKIREKIGEMRRNTNQEARKLLSEEQRAKVKELLQAERIELDFGRPGFRRRGGGGPGGRPERRPGGGRGGRPGGRERPE